MILAMSFGSNPPSFRMPHMSPDVIICAEKSSCDWNDLFRFFAMSSRACSNVCEKGPCPISWSRAASIAVLARG